MADTAIRVLIADDHHIVREGLRLILEATEGLAVVGEARSGEEAVARVDELCPHVVLMDIRMPGIGGIEAIRRIRSTCDTEVVILTTYDEDELMLDGLRAGAKGYLLKDTDRETLFNSIRAAARGETLLRPEVLERVLESRDRGAGQERTAGRSAADVRPKLTARESEILEAVASDTRLRDVAVRFGITERTVKAHLASIYGKLGVDSRAGAVAKALREGLVDR